MKKFSHRNSAKKIENDNSLSKLISNFIKSYPQLENPFIKNESGKKKIIDDVVFSCRFTKK